jgi:proteasome lid subunit RPN8/RPN11
MTTRLMGCMITWNEQKPDFARRSLDDLVSHMPFTTACAVALGDRGTPRVLVGQPVMDGILSHLKEQNVEMGGLLLGRVHDGLGGGGNFVIAVADFVRSIDFNGTSVSLRMDPGVWERARAQSVNGATVVGWYHSHPDLGAFFSGTDRSTQRAFFSQAHGLGLVVDPVRLQEKWFLGADSVELAPAQIMRRPA